MYEHMDENGDTFKRIMTEEGEMEVEKEDEGEEDEVEEEDEGEEDDDEVEKEEGEEDDDEVERGGGQEEEEMELKKVEDNFMFLERGDPMERISRAVVYVDHALSLRGKIYKISTRKYSIQIHWFLHNAAIIRYIALTSLLLLAFFETPSWCYTPEDTCGDPTITLQSGIPKVSISDGLSLELSFLLVLSLYSFLNYWKMTSESWFSDRWAILEVVVLFLSILDVLIGFGFYRRWRLSPYFRPILFLTISLSVRDTFLGILSGIRDIAHILLLQGLLILFAGWSGVLLFQGTPEDVVFQDLPSAMLEMMILLTTCNFPDIGIPELRVHRSTILFFAVFLLLGLWLLMNLLYATIYSSYRSRIRLETALRKRKRKAGLVEAFQELTAITETKEEKGMVGEKVVRAMFREMNRYFHLPHIPQKMEHVFWMALCNGKEKIQEEQFLRIILHPFFDYGIDIIIILNITLTGLELWVPNINLKPYYEISFCGIYVLEMFLKIVAYGGFKQYWDKHRNKFDALIAVTSLVVEIVSLCTSSRGGVSATKVVLLFRIVRILRLTTSFRPYRILAGTFFHLFYVFLRLTGVLVIIYYFFGLIGIASFGGKISLDNPNLNNTIYADNDYYTLNFNDFGGAMVTLFVLMAVNNWNYIMEAYVAVSIEGARIFFILFWLFAVVMILSVVLAAVLDRLGIEVRKKEGDGISDIDPILIRGIEGLRYGDKGALVVSKMVSKSY